jgi:hypothetical protein
MTESSTSLRRSPLEAVRALQSVFSRQGTIVASWQTYRGRKLGPYYRLAYRADGRQRSIYLGKSKNLLRQVRRLLDKLQKPSKTSRILRHAQKTAQADLKTHMAQFRIELLKVGLQLRGYAARGWRRWRAMRNLHTPGRNASILRRLSVRLHPSFLKYPSPSPRPPNNGAQTSELPV